VISDELVAFKVTLLGEKQVLAFVFNPFQWT
jgi:hypothetical protein